MADAELKYQERNTSRQQGRYIRDKKSTAAVAVGHVAETPDIAESYCRTYCREDKPELTVPLLPLYGSATSFREIGCSMQKLVTTITAVRAIINNKRHSARAFPVQALSGHRINQTSATVLKRTV